MAASRERERVSPRRCGEKPWDLWVAELGRGEPARDEPRRRQRRRARLRRAAMRLYGECPDSDPLLAALCHLCGHVVKCSAARRHLVERHADPLPPPPRPPQRPAPVRPKQRRPQPSAASPPPPSQPAPAAAPAPPASAEVNVSVEDDDPPVVSIRDDAAPAVAVAEDPVDDIIEIMNSEGIRPADDRDADAWKALVGETSARAPGSAPRRTQPAPRKPSRPPAPAAPPPPPPPTVAPEPPPARARQGKPPKPKYAAREYDPNRHCGVVANDGSKPCTRSLTCKSHALFLRRTVDGRAKPFDALLAEHRAAKQGVPPEVQPASAAPVARVPSPPPTPTPPPPLPPPPPPRVVSPFAALVAEVKPPAEAFAPPSPTPEPPPVAPSFAAASFAPPPFVAPAFAARAFAPPPPPVGEFDAAEPAQAFLPRELVDRLAAQIAVAEAAAVAAASTAGPEAARLPECDASDVHWYARGPRPLAACTFSACRMGSALLLNRRLATVRSDFKAATAASRSKAPPDPLGGTSRAALPPGGAAKRAAPEARRLVASCAAFAAPRTKPDRGSRGSNGHRYGGEDAAEADGRPGAAVPAKAGKMSSRSDSLDLSFSFLDPLMADEKC